jgi:hypothetical protein
MRFATPIVAIALSAGLLLGCGNSDSSSGTTSGAGAGASTAPAGAQVQRCPTSGGQTKSLKATGANCTEAHRVMSAWLRNRSCEPPAGASRAACQVGAYRCLAAATDRGWSVGCARQGNSISFTFRRG